LNAKADEIKWALQPTKDAVFEGLMSEYGDKILQLVYLNVKDRTIAEDITQEVFISAYRHLETFRGESSYKTWLYRIAINETKKYLRSWSFRKIFSTIKTKDEKPVETADQINLETIVMTKQDKAEIAFARTNEAEEKTLEALSKAIPSVQAYRLEAKTPDTRGYSMLLRTEDTQLAAKHISISVSGPQSELIGYSVDRESAAETGKAPDALAIEKATQFIQQIVGADSGNYRRLTYDGPTSFQRYVNGIPVIGDTLRVSVDGAGQVRSFSRDVPTLDQSAFPSLTEAVSKEAAKKELAANMKLKYEQGYVARRDPATNKPLETRTLLEYTPAVTGISLGRSPSPAWYIDAKSGKMEYGFGNNGIDYDRAKRTAPIPVTPPKQPVIVKSKAEAAQLLQAEFDVDLSKLIYRERSESQNTKTYAWKTAAGKETWVTTDARTGQVIQLNYPRADKKDSITEQAALAEATRFLQKYIDTNVEEVQLATVIPAGLGNGYTSSGDWEFCFFKSHDGVPLLDATGGDAYTVTVDPSTGKANYFRNTPALMYGARDDAGGTASMGAESFPDKASVVPVEEAVEEYLKYLPLELAYLVRDVNGQLHETPILAYVPMSSEADAAKSFRIDAVTGKVIVK
jgi:RNA polymerase sigma factor (sigma-70 family)